MLNHLFFLIIVQYRCQNLQQIFIGVTERSLPLFWLLYIFY